MAFYIEKEQLYIDTYVPGVSLGVSLLQVRDGEQVLSNKTPDNSALCPMAVMNRALTSAETCYSSTEREALCTFHDLEK